MDVLLDCFTLILAFGVGAAIMIGADHLLRSQMDEEIRRERDKTTGFYGSRL